MTEGKLSNVHDILLQCAEIEDVMAQLYVHFAVAYREVPGMEALFRKTAAEEKNHENQFRLAIRNYAGRVRKLKQTLESTRHHLEIVRRILAGVQTSLPTVEEALAKAIHMETIFGNFHMTTAAQFDDENCAKMFRALMAADIGHKECLEMALQVYRQGQK